MSGLNQLEKKQVNPSVIGNHKKKVGIPTSRSIQRVNSFIQLSRKREAVADLAIYPWYSAGVVSA
jgi:hypothetical protein